VNVEPVLWSSLAARLIAEYSRDAGLLISGMGSLYSIQRHSATFGRLWNGLNGMDRMSASMAWSVSKMARRYARWQRGLQVTASFSAGFEWEFAGLADAKLAGSWSFAGCAEAGNHPESPGFANVVAVGPFRLH
jgi:hypothetical protein